MPFKVTDFGTNRKLISDFLLVINTNLPRILHCFWDIAFDRSKIAIFLLPLLGLTPPTEGNPWDDLHKIFCACQQVARVLKAVEKLPKITTTWVGMSRVHERYRQQTDRRATAYSEREC